MIRFVTTGVLALGSKAYLPAFSTLFDITNAMPTVLSQLGGDGRLPVTADFDRTIENTCESNMSGAY